MRNQALLCRDWKQKRDSDKQLVVIYNENNIYIIYTVIIQNLSSRRSLVYCVRVDDMVDELPSAAVFRELSLLSPQRDIDSESNTLTNNYIIINANNF